VNVLKVGEETVVICARALMIAMAMVHATTKQENVHATLDGMALHVLTRCVHPSRGVLKKWGSAMDKGLAW